MTCSGVNSPSNECLTVCGWGPPIINIFRAHIGDFSTPHTWTDSRLTDILVAAAYQVSIEATCITSPTINIATYQFSSNPFLYPAYLNLVLLKGACLIDRGQLRTRALQEGVRATCGPAMLEVKSGGSSAYTILFEHGPCAAYKDLLENLCFRDPLQTAANCVQVVGTFVSQYYQMCNGYRESRCC